MLLRIKTAMYRLAHHLRAAVSRALGWLSLFHYSMPQLMLRAGALMLVALPVAELAIGLDLMIGLDLITTLAVLAPTWGVLAAIIVAGVLLWRRLRRRSRRSVVD